MDKFARSLLEKLLVDAEKSAVGRRSRPAALTKSNLAEYQACKSLQSKEAFEAIMMAARAVNAISFEVANRGVDEGFIQRVEVLDSRALAGFLSKVPAEDHLARARELLTPLVERFPVLNTVLQQWGQLKTVRTFTAADAQDWADAVRVIDFAQENLAPDRVSMPINEASGKLFKDTKRIKKLAAPIDVLLAGSIDVESREPSEVWAEIKLFREEHPVRMAGNIIVERDQVTARLDVPYSALPADSIRRLIGTPSLVLTIENQTTFHSEARRRCNDNVLLIFTSGMPNPPWRAMYSRVLKELPPEIPVFHWGDIDEGGFRIASVLAKDAMKCGHIIKPWPAMRPDNVPIELRSGASKKTIGRMVQFAESAGWGDLAVVIAEAGFTVEQESLA